MARTTGKWRDRMKNNADVTRIVTYTVGKWRFVVFSYFVSRCHGGIWPTLSKCFAFALYQPWTRVLKVTIGARLETENTER